MTQDGYDKNIFYAHGNVRAIFFLPPPPRPPLRKKNTSRLNLLFEKPEINYTFTGTVNE